MKRLATLAFVAALLASPVAAGTVIFDPTAPLRPTDTVVTKDLGTANENVSIVGTLLPGGTVTYKFNFLKALKISDIAVSGTGKVANVGKVTFGPMNTNFSQIVSTGVQAWGGGHIPGGVFKTGDTLNVQWYSNDITGPVAVTASFRTADVPLPAGVVLLPGALAMLGLGMARRKRK